MRKRFWSATIAVLALALSARGAFADAALDSLVSSERAFSAMSAAQGMKAAFLEFLGEDAIVFAPTPTNGRQVWQARQPSKATLVWEPEFAEVSSSGDLGYTTGPWELQPPADTTAAAADSAGAHPDSAKAAASTPPKLYGHFNTVWRKQRHGAWRVAVDIGGQHAKPNGGGVGDVTFEEGSVLPRRTMKGGRVDLRDADRDLSKAMRKAGADAAIATWAATDIRLSTEGQFPAHGIDAVQVRLDSLAGFFEYLPQGTAVAAAGDLGYTYGLAARFTVATAAAADTSVYLNVWRQDGRDWKLALTVLNPLKR
ncbi:MAG: hypothetical protein E6K81_11915 [Candidatus Eisenbacteria bacterium]|uniref:Nuclear transport factor 2 family protein n=1 Tax=Eiseniibacteriota bacterium TaxID=2212470 RepID=A0A538U4B8_UNCEI|nr:MAG: hypothetical protein E6K81_11915 [Candidatus Eisenbacteria bacterium]